MINLIHTCTQIWVYSYSFTQLLIECKNFTHTRTQTSRATGFPLGSSEIVISRHCNWNKFNHYYVSGDCTCIAKSLHMWVYSLKVSPAFFSPVQSNIHHVFILGQRSPPKVLPWPNMNPIKMIVRPKLLIWTCW